ncbi:unnamed protein product, partial [Prunus brigantina]
MSVQEDGETAEAQLGHAEAKTFLSKAVYLISIGSNDYFAPFTSNSSLFEFHSHKEFVGLVIGNLKKVIKVIYTVFFFKHIKHGKHFESSFFLF